MYKNFEYVSPKIIQDMKQTFNLEVLISASEQKMNTPEESYGFLKGCLYMIQMMAHISKSQCADGEDE